MLLRTPRIVGDLSSVETESLSGGAVSVATVGVLFDLYHLCREIYQFGAHPGATPFDRARNLYVTVSEIFRARDCVSSSSS